MFKIPPLSTRSTASPFEDSTYQPQQFQIRNGTITGSKDPRILTSRFTQLHEQERERLPDIHKPSNDRLSLKAKTSKKVVNCPQLKKSTQLTTGQKIIKAVDDYLDDPYALNRRHFSLDSEAKKFLVRQVRVQYFAWLEKSKTLSRVALVERQVRLTFKPYGGKLFANLFSKNLRFYRRVFSEANRNPDPEMAERSVWEGVLVNWGFEYLDGLSSPSMESIQRKAEIRLYELLERKNDREKKNILANFTMDKFAYARVTRTIMRDLIKAHRPDGNLVPEWLHNCLEGKPDLAGCEEELNRSIAAEMCKALDEHLGALKKIKRMASDKDIDSKLANELRKFSELHYVNPVWVSLMVRKSKGELGLQRIMERSDSDSGSGDMNRPNEKSD